MPEEWQITCVKKTSSPSAHECIERVGGPAGEGWTLSIKETIEYIRQGGGFWVDVGGRRYDIIIASSFGRDYLKTETDGDYPTNLMSLPECSQ
jgi:hypothetical protein